MIVLALSSGVIFGAPLFGAIDALSWSVAADGNGAQRVAALLYAQTQLNPAAAAAKGRLHGGSCGQAIYQSSEEGHVTLSDALDHYRRHFLRSKYDNLAIRSLAALKAPLLGALNGCANGSPAAGFCLSYAHRIASRATEMTPAAEDMIFANVDRRVERALCAVAPVSIVRS
ncbi:hypothetical protein [Sphingomonas sp. PB4P5]|uniref:hypothetical protein n=1 Tax=Parasphingomonas puruogangriensis TaxID=3096155 RepID=UPI002FC5B67A